MMSRAPGEATLVALRDRGISIEASADLITLFSEAGGLFDLVTEALVRVHGAFGEDASIHLEPFSDPETIDPVVRAYLVVHTALEMETAEALMEGLEQRWWLDNCRRASPRLSLAIEYL